MNDNNSSVLWHQCPPAAFVRADHHNGDSGQGKSCWGGCYLNLFERQIKFPFHFPPFRAFRWPIQIWRWLLVDLEASLWLCGFAGSALDLPGCFMPQGLWTNSFFYPWKTVFPYYSEKQLFILPPPPQSFCWYPPKLDWPFSLLCSPAEVHIPLN